MRGVGKELFIVALNKALRGKDIKLMHTLIALFNIYTKIIM